jgi:hypothetical protein
MSQAMNDPIILQIIDLLVKESIMVARANEISLGWDFYTYCMGYMRNAGDHKPSMLVDIENHRRTEIDFINGKIVEYGRQAGVETPYNLMIRALVKALEGKNLRTPQAETPDPRDSDHFAVRSGSLQKPLHRIKRHPVRGAPSWCNRRPDRQKILQLL